MALKRMSIKVSEEMHDWLKIEADKRGLTMNAIIIFALENYYKESIALPSIQKAMELMEMQRNGQVVYVAKAPLCLVACECKLSGVGGSVFCYCPRY